MQVDSPELVNEFAAFMTQYFDEVYAHQENEFFQRCLFVCDRSDTPVATCLGWKAYGNVSTIHWFKVSKQHEGRGIARALLSMVMKTFGDRDYPIFLHTQPGSFRAIKLYSDFGFVFLTDATIGYRRNELTDGLPYLQAPMLPDAYNRLQFARAPNTFLEAVQSSPINQF
jgi:ribosomal protein S18 acetylase RimI-like enzyme